MAGVRLLSAIFLLNFAFAVPVLAVSQRFGSDCSGQLTITSGHEGNREIYLLSSGNHPLLNVTSNPQADDYNPIWSPDGRYLVFDSRQQGGQTRLQLLDTSTSNTLTLAEADRVTYNFHAEWAPNGQQIAFVTQEGELAVADTSGEIKRIVNADFRLRTPVTWSPDGDSVVFTPQVIEKPPRPGETWHISTANVRTGEIAILASIRFLDDGFDPREPNWPYWLPDHRHLVVTRNYPGGPDYGVDVIDLDTMTLRRVEDRIVSLGRPYLDDMALLYSTGADLNVLDLITGTVRNLTDHFEERVILQALSPSTGTTAFNTYENPNHIYLMDIDRKILLHIANLTSIDSFAWRPSQCP